MKVSLWHWICNHISEGDYIIRKWKLIASTLCQPCLVLYLKKEPLIVVIKSSFKTERIFFMAGSRWVLVNVVLFQLGGLGFPWMMPCPLSYLIQKAIYQSFEMRYYIFLSSLKKVVEVVKIFSWKPALWFNMITSVIVICCTFITYDMGGIPIWIHFCWKKNSLIGNVSRLYLLKRHGLVAMKCHNIHQL